MRYILSFLFIIAIASCNSTVQKTAVSADSSVVYKYDTLEGAYLGDFGGSDIRVVLTHVTGRHATGYNLHKGLRRNMSGTMQQAGSNFIFMLNEPGDNKFDGKFSFTIDTATFTLTGSWMPLNNKNLTQHYFTLKRLVDTGINQYALYYMWADSIGTFTFSKKGVCVYEFYPVVNGTPAEQLIRVTGSWSKKDSVYTVDWAPNTIFPARRSVFTEKLVRVDSTDYTMSVLTGEGRTLSMDEGF